MSSAKPVPISGGALGAVATRPPVLSLRGSVDRNQSRALWRAPNAVEQSPGLHHITYGCRQPCTRCWNNSPKGSSWRAQLLSCQGFILPR